VNYISDNDCILKKNHLFLRNLILQPMHALFLSTLRRLLFSTTRNMELTYSRSKHLAIFILGKLRFCGRVLKGMIAC